MGNRLKSAFFGFFLLSGLFLFCSKESNILEDPGNELSGVDTLRTINSLVKLDNALYTMTVYGDYSEILGEVNKKFVDPLIDKRDPAIPVDNHCSLFSAFGNPGTFLLGRSFDNPAGWRCLTLLVRTNPPNGYRSLALVRMRDFGYELGTPFDLLTLEEKLSLLEAPFHPPDGINEHGVVAGLANVRTLSFTPDPEKESIWITLLVRKILDHAANVDEAVDIAIQHNICCPTSRSLGVHVLVADPSGHSVILELYGGQLRVIPNSRPWQVLTNSPVYNVPIEMQRIACWRFDTIYGQLESAQGSISTNDTENFLNQVGNEYTQWSAIYNMSRKEIVLFVDYDFNKPYYFTF
jgi:hypothetical protein